MARGITKYSAMIDDPQSIRYHLERAMHLAVTGRPGPCWIDVPVDVQGASIDPDTLPGYDPAEDPLTFDRELLTSQCREIVERIKNAARPVIMVGSGVRVGHAEKAFYRLIHKLGIPVTTAWTGRRLGRQRRSALLWPAWHDRRPRRQLHRSKLRFSVGHRLAAEHSPSELQLAKFRASCFQGSGRYRPSRTAKAVGQARHAGACRRQSFHRGVVSRHRRERLRFRPSSAMGVVVPRTRREVSGRVAASSIIRRIAESLLFLRFRASAFGVRTTSWYAPMELRRSSVAKRRRYCRSNGFFAIPAVHQWVSICRRRLERPLPAMENESSALPAMEASR